jgi:hypothetical protein
MKFIFQFFLKGYKDKLDYRKCNNQIENKFEIKISLKTSMHSNEKSFGFTNVGVNFKEILQFFKIIHEENLPRFFIYIFHESNPVITYYQFIIVVNKLYTSNINTE